MLVVCGDAGRFEALQRKHVTHAALRAKLNNASNTRIRSFREYCTRHRTAIGETGKLDSARETFLTAAIHRAEPSSTVPENKRRRAAFCSHQSESASIEEGAQVVPSQAQSAESRSNTRKSSNAWYCTFWGFHSFDNRLNTIRREGYYSLRFQHKREQFQCGGTRPETDFWMQGG
jgi:hypothetical protein